MSKIFFNATLLATMFALNPAFAADAPAADKNKLETIMPANNADDDCPMHKGGKKCDHKPGEKCDHHHDEKHHDHHDKCEHDKKTK